VIAGTPTTSSHTDSRTVALSRSLRAQAFGLGFDLVGLTTLGPVATADEFESWLGRGYAGGMDYLHRGAPARRDTRLPLAGAVSAVVVGLDYGGREPAGPVARYARGDDYHDVIGSRLRDLHRWLESEVGGPVGGKAYVDTGPILERDLARRAGLGWFGKNTNLINPRQGSFFFLGALLLELELEADAPFDEDRCGRCTACIDACPTQAIVAPRELDATRCVSYLTIEHRGPIPPELRAPMGELLYGCDVCQDVCPWNIRFSHQLRDDALRPRTLVAGKDGRTLAREILAMDEATYRSRLAGSPMKRAKRSGLARNAAVVLGNVGDESDRDLLTGALAHDDPVVREHAAWGLDRIDARTRDAGSRRE
jgi:epoxyqueuosine reductase